MGNYFKYERISTKEERELQKYTRQDKALDKYAKENNIDWFGVFRDDASGKSFDRREWKKLENGLHEGDTIVFKELSRFTRECENGYFKYMELMDKGIHLIFLDNPTLNTDYIKQMTRIAEENSNRIARLSLMQTIELLIMVELDRVETERLVIVKRIKDGLIASTKKSGRPLGKLDKMTDDLIYDIKLYLKNRTMRQIDLMHKHNVSRNTLKKYINLIRDESIVQE